MDKDTCFFCGKELSPDEISNNDFFLHCSNHKLQADLATAKFFKENPDFMKWGEKQVAVLFAMKDSIYNQYAECDVYDKERNALSFCGDLPVIAHPPCRAWGRLRSFAKPEPGEKELAFFALEMVRKNGGVLEHPESSKLWEEANLPFGLNTDDFGGWTLKVDQFWWGHKARKRTWLYICGIERRYVSYPIRFDAIQYTVSTTMNRGRKHFKPKPTISKRDRSATPKLFAEWLIDLAKKTSNNIK